MFRRFFYWLLIFEIFINQTSCCVSQCTSCIGVCFACTGGYYVKNFSCSACQKPCQNCNNSATSCTSCVDASHQSTPSCNCQSGMGMDTTTYMCFNCSSNCDTCTSGTVCTLCYDGYYLNANACSPCTKPCQSCSSSSTNCSTCVDTTNQVTPTCACKEAQILNTSSYLCDSCPSNCKVCSSTSVCTQCYDGYLLSATVCIPCTKPCAKCSSSVTTCDTCVDTSKQSPPLCNCTSGYVINTTSYLCDQCTFPCATCQTSVTYCLTCAATYTKNTSTCSCQNNQFELSGTPKTCQLCTSPCQTCSTSATNCNSCVAGLNRHLVGNQCNCDDGYYENVVCQPCVKPCINCTSASNCTSCNDPTHQSGSSCSCQQTFYMDSSFVCRSCVSPCLNCNSPTVCTSCVDNYYLSGNTCIQCTLPCYNCVDLASKCTTCAYQNQSVSNNACVCDNGYYMDGSLQCQPCIHPCIKCQTNGNHCTECASTYIMSTVITNTCKCPTQTYEVVAHNPTDCQACTQPCDTCTGSADYCLTCIDIHQTVNASHQCVCNSGYLMSGVNCVTCANPCLQCSGSTTYCTQCKDAQHQVTTGACICNPGWVNDNNYDCITCQLPCVTCSINDTHCESCKDPNHEINASYQCICKDTYYSDTIDSCASCTQPCDNCDINGCLTCIDSNQIIDSSQNCICKPGYYAVSVNCSQCSLPCQTCDINQDHCLTCVDVNQTLISHQCICNDGYFEVSNYCQQCQLPCTKCEISNDRCLECLDPNHDLIDHKCVCKFGYGSSGNGGINCSFCQYPCLDCSTSVNTCLSCLDSSLFHLQDNKCLCQEGYFSMETQCKRCSPQCLTCTDESEICLKCSDLNHDFMQNSCICKFGYYTDTQMKCSKCQPPCVTCDINYDYCTSCHDDNQSIVDGQCLCDNGYYLSNLKCAKCNKICTKCNSYSDCTECADKYYLSDSSCLQCQIPCITCLDISTCISCADNYFMNYLGECIQCISNCKQCLDTTSCIICYDQFYYENSLCIPCYDNCKSCENSSNFCTSCIDINHQLIDNKCICRDGYYEENYVCKPCDPTCKTCVSLNFCIECGAWNHIVLLNNLCVCDDGYYQSHFKCDQCDKSCLTCSQTSNYCLSCNSQLNRILLKNACVCQKGYFENEKNECWTCNSNEGKIIKECQYKDCSDYLWTYGEDCDDGNNITRDGCSNCKVDTNYSCINTLLEPSLCFQCSENCIECQLNEIQKLSECIKCKDGFFILQSKCAKCADKCLTCDTSASNCKSCRYLKNDLGECQLCESKIGYYSDQINNQCYSKCGDSFKAVTEDCDDGNLLAGDGCDQNCKKEKKFVCKDGICITPEYPKPQLINTGDTSLYNNQRSFKLEYNLLLNITQDSGVENEFDLYIKNEIAENPIDCQYQKQLLFTLNNQSKIEFSVSFDLQFNRSSIKEQLIIKYRNISKFISYQGYSQQELQVVAAISDYMFIDQSSVAQVQMATNSNQYVLYVMAVMGGGAILFGGIDIFYNLLDTIQMLSYLKYVNTQLPFNLQEFFDFFGFAQLNFISKYLKLQELIEPFINYQNLTPIPQKIGDDDLNSLFIINGASILAVWLSLLGIYVVSTFVPQILQKFKFKYYTEIPGGEDFTIKLKLMFLAAKIFITQLCYIIVSEFFYSGIFRTLFATAYDYSFSMTLQLYALELYSPDFLVRLSSYFALGALGIYLLAIYIVTQINGSASISQEQFSNKQKYGSLSEGIKKDKYSKYFNAIVLAKKLLFMLILIFCYPSPFFQAINLTLLSSLQTIFLIFFKPLEDDKEYKKQLSCEINTASSLLLISSLVLDQELKIFSDDLRTKIGWFCIANISLIFVIQLIIDAIQQWIILIKKYRQLKRLVEKINQLFYSRIPQQTSHDIFIRTDIQNN
ncbi:unnamed protein product (macronuclear) [Paramecium tetraurelia]|uniref:EGF-like domain-containing protein n=1 Tax=Paramecium tetraurelia TaxID=5888 RepID=A0EH89_PARTE|nr:uncharacterized protein GSPATT00027004001 [Paramecium tetraurelia]CAK94680.1 unnamed protein product [Paramecium tetraurelia]|eukprot:XP_001462053.1 hypothetical protein (macronuclear) [Paramecium tetraurelia strain d4-2]